jgi:hypothetical protein
MIEKLKAMFESKNVATFSPGDELPGGWVESIATWPAAVEWQDHPQVKAYKARGKFKGWDRRGNKLWTGER